MILSNRPIAIVLTLLLFLIGFTGKSETGEQNIELELRSIGHQFLTSIGDSTSRVLPIERDGDQFIMSFERSFSFDPDILVRSVLKNINSHDTKIDYLVEVKSCTSEQIVHSFQTKFSMIPDEVACVGRKLPNDCYEFYFTVQNSSTENSSGFISKNALPLSLLLLISLGFIGAYFYSKRKEPVITNSSVLQIGEYEFDPTSMTLTFQGNSISLSGKESDLLLLLFQQKNEIINREEILDKVWDDDGNYVGRTLDVYISKLRKKLELDPSIQIINVRGVGYKMVVE